MKYNKLIIIVFLSLFLISCNKEKSNQIDFDNTNINDIVAEKNIEDTKLLPLSKIVNGDKKWGYVSSQNLNEKILEFQYDQPVFFDESYGFAIVSKNKQIGVIDKLGNEFIPFGTYKSLYQGSEDIIYGTTQEDIHTILDYKGNVFYVLKEGQNIYKRKNGILEINSATKHSYFNVNEKEIVVLDSESYEIRENNLNLANTPYKIQNNADNKLNISKDGNFITEKTYASIEYVENYFIVGTRSDKTLDYYEDITKLGLMDEKGHIIINPSYYDLKQLHKDYFGVAKFDNSDFNYKQYSDKTYKKAIFRKEKALTDFTFYIIEYVKDDIFYVYDGVEYYFLNVNNNKKVMADLMIDGPFEISLVDDIIIFYNSSHENGEVIIYVKNNKIIKKLTETYQLESGSVLTDFKAAGIDPVFYPIFIYSDKIIEEKINNSIEKIFDISYKWDLDLDSERYSIVGNTGFNVSEFKNILEITQSYYWYGLGAAHGNYGNLTYNYDLITGDLFTLENLFKENINFDEVITFAIRKAIINNPNLPESLYIDINNMNDNETIEFFKKDIYNFKINSEGLLIYYNPYEIGPYAAGIIEIQIPLSIIKKDLKSEKPWL
jgi:hypothetical protein